MGGEMEVGGGGWRVGWRRGEERERWCASAAQRVHAGGPAHRHEKRAAGARGGSDELMENE